ncbi:hypothetical protein SDC9_212025 [bioreactor metagenome]|uniref:Uncharacterized protein n=1 Tax=bioreactor metagenome TaxID=1076179 RepID=A0A645JXD3_9ZZZZ
MGRHGPGLHWRAGPVWREPAAPLGHGLAGGSDDLRRSDTLGGDHADGEGYRSGAHRTGENPALPVGGVRCSTAGCGGLAW